MAKVNVRDRNKGKSYKDGRKKPPSWEWRFEMAKVNGERSHASKGGYKTKREAELAGAKALAEYLNQGQHIKEKEMSVSDYLDEWMVSYVVPNLRNNTQTTYRNLVERHIKPRIGHYKLSTLTPAQLQEFSKEVYANSAANTASHIMRTLRTALNYAVEPLRYLKSNPILYIKKQRIQATQKPMKVLTKQQWESLMELFHERHRFHLPLMIGFYTGLRMGEVIGLTWDDIDFENQTITVRKQQVRHITGKGKGSIKFCLGDVKTSTSNRVISIGETLIELLRRNYVRQKTRREYYREHYRTYDLREFKDKNGQTLYEIIESPNDTVRFVCTDESGKHFNGNTFTACMRYARRNLGFDFEFHGLRHTHATILVEAGINPKTLQERLGHKHVQTTLSVYTHNTKTLDKSAAATFEVYTRGQK